MTTVSMAHTIQGVCVKCGLAIRMDCCGEYEGVWRMEGGPGDSGGYTHEPIRASEGKVKR